MGKKGEDGWKSKFKFINIESAWKGLPWKWPRTRIDLPVAYLHYRLTVFLLVGGASLLSVKQYYGEPIQCLTDFNNATWNAFADSYCLFHSTYTVPKGNPGQPAHCSPKASLPFMSS